MPIALRFFRSDPASGSSMAMQKVLTYDMKQVFVWMQAGQR